MTDPPIYLFKGARRPLYRKENLHLLAEERGAIVELAWNRSWVSPLFFDDGSIQRGRLVYFVFTDRPYTRFVPVRAGEVVSSEWDNLMLRLRVSLRNHVGLDDMDVPRYTRLVKHAATGHCPGDKFVGPKRDGVELVNFYDEKEHEGWRRVVDEVLAMSAESDDDAYRRSVFFRAVGLRVGDDDLASARRVPLEPGTRATLVLGFHNPHLSDDALAGHRLRFLAPDDVLHVDAPDAVQRDGTVDVEVEPLAADGELTVQVGPASAQHTHLVERFRTRAEPERSGTDAGSEVAIESDSRRSELLGLYDFVCRNARFEVGDHIDFFDRFAHLLPDEQRIREDWGLFHFQRGDADAALRVLSTLDPERISNDEARIALFQLHVHSSDAAHRAEPLGLLAESRFPQLLDVLSELTPALLARIVPALVATLPIDQIRDLMARVGDLIESPDALVATAHNLYYTTEDGDWAYRWLLDRSVQLRLADAATEDAILDLAAAATRQHDDPELDNIAGRRVANLVERGEVEAARKRLRGAGQVLGDAERGRLYHRVADRFIDKERWSDGAYVMVELAWAELNEAHLLQANDAVSRAAAIWTRTGEDLPSDISQCIRAVEEAWEELEPLRVWRASEAERHQAMLRARYMNRRILIAGGQRNEDWLRYLCELTGADIDWCRAFRNETDDLKSFAERIENRQYDLVVHYAQKTGHGTADILKPACNRAGVVWVNSTSPGRDGVEAALRECAAEGARTDTLRGKPMR